MSGLLLVITLLVVACSGRAQPGADDSAYARAVQAMPPELQPLLERTGMALVHVTDGTAGSSQAQQAGRDFWIGLTEVTNEQYQHFLDDGGYDNAEFWSKDGWEWRKDDMILEPCRSRSKRAQMPVACVSWYEADAYTRWLSDATGLDVRLPTGSQWELAAGGTDGRTYPWGDDPPTPDHANYRRYIIPPLIEPGTGWPRGPNRPVRVGSHPAGASPYGALDMAGNVWEWTARRWDGAVARGGSYGSEPTGITVDSQRAFMWPDRGSYIGFRVVVVPPP